MSRVAVVGAGPNGLAAGCVAARAGLDVTVYEANTTIGGAARTIPLDGSEAVFDVGSAVHPMALLSPAFADLKVRERVDFLVPQMSYAHVLDQRTAYAWQDLDRTVEHLDSGSNLPLGQGAVFAGLLGPLVQRINQLGDTLLNPLLRLPAHPGTLAAFGAATLGGMGLQQALSRRYPKAAALLAGCAAHVAGGSRGPAGAGAGLFLAAAAHAGGWPIPRGGSQAISQALATELRAHGGRIETGRRIEELGELDAQTILLDTSPETAARLGRGRIPHALAQRLANPRRSPGSCVVHYVLREPVPWRDPLLAQAGTIHLAGTARQVLRTERESRRRPADHPFVLVSQPSQFDPTRAPGGQQVLWAYCHVPLGSDANMAPRITAQLEAAAPGFRDVVLEQHVRTARGLQRQNPALVGGDLSGGTMDLLGSVRRPRVSTNPWWLQSKGLYLVSSATPPGPSVHGMGGYLGAKAMLSHEFGIR